MLYIVGFGPGSYEQMTVEADRALQGCDLIIGYTTYVDIIRPWFPEKEFLVTPMKQEKERCLIAIEEEKKGKKAPLSHDFLTISLSDLLTPMEVIRTRIRCGAKSDTVLCIYNPSSRKRGDYLQMACDIVLEWRSPRTVCGYVRNIGRDGEEAVVTTLEELRNTNVDMFTTVFIGNSHTRNIHGKMVTPRGYRLEEAKE